MKLLGHAILLITLSTLISCGNKENIEPVFQSKTFNNTLEEQQKSDSFFITYKFGDFEVDRIGQGVGSVPIIGGLLQRVTESFADIIISAEGGKNYEIEPTVFTIPELDEVDFSMIKELTVEEVVLEALTEHKSHRVDLSFIEDIQISLIGTVPANPQKIDKEDAHPSKKKVKLLHLRGDKGDSPSDSERLRLASEKNNLKQVIQNYRKFKVVTKLVLDSVPKEDMSLSGKVRFRLKVDPGF